EAAIDHDGLRGQIAGGGQAYQTRNGGNLVERRQPLQCGSFGASALKILVRVAQVVRVKTRRVGVDVTDVEAVDRDAARAELEREVAHHALQRGLGGAKHAVAGQIANRVDSRNHQHAPALAHHPARFLNRGDESVDAQRKGAGKVVRLDFE